MLSVGQEAIVGNVNFGSNHDAIIRIYMDRQRAVAPKRTWGPLIFISKFKFL